MKRNLIKKIMLVAFVSISIALSAENEYDQKYVGGSLSGGVALTSSDMTCISGGLFYEHQFSHFFSYELGLYSYNVNMQSNVMGSYLHYLSFPVGINFVSKIVNLGAGIKPRIYTGFSVIQGATDGVYNVQTDPFCFGLFAKLSKNIALTPHLTLEPQIGIQTQHLNSPIFFDFTIRMKYGI